MKYYQVKYNTGKKNEIIYPQAVRETVWKITQNHFRDKVMIGGTESEIMADGKGVKELKEAEASTLIEEFKKSFPEVKKEDLTLPGEEPASPPKKKTIRKTTKK